MSRSPRIRYLGSITTPAGYESLSVSTGTLTLSGQIIVLKVDRTLVISSGTLTLIGQSVTLKRALKLSVTSNTLTLSGQDITLTKSSLYIVSNFYVPRILVSEPRLIVPGQIPIGAVKLDVTHPFSKHIIFGQTGQIGAPGIVNGRSITEWSAYTSEFGRYRLTNTQNGNLPNFDSMGLGNECTILYGRIWYDTGSNPAAFGYDNLDYDRLLAHIPWIDGNVYWDFGTSDTGRLSATTPGFVAGKHDWWCFVASESSAIGRQIWRNGTMLASDTSKTASRPQQTTGAEFNARATGDGYSMTMLGFYVFNKVLDGGSLSRDPYQFLIPA